MNKREACLKAVHDLNNLKSFIELECWETNKYSKDTVDFAFNVIKNILYEEEQFLFEEEVKCL